MVLCGVKVWAHTCLRGEHNGGKGSQAVRREATRAVVK
jgi:hypothetical protein